MVLKSGETMIENPLEVAEAFNMWFKEKIEILVKKINKTASQSPFEKLKKHLAGKKLNFALSPVDVKDVLKVLSELKPKTSYGLDGISSEIMKMCKEEMAGPITLIVNRSICSGKFPDQWKIAKVAPLLKKGYETIVVLREARELT